MSESSPLSKEDLQAMNEDLEKAKSLLSKKTEEVKPSIDPVKLKEEIKSQIFEEMKAQEKARLEEESKQVADKEKEEALQKVKELEEKIKSFSESKAIAKPNNPFSDEENKKIDVDPKLAAIREQELMEAMLNYR